MFAVLFQIVGNAAHRKPGPGLISVEECCSIESVTPAGAMLSVPLAVIGPPVKPAPLATLDTVPLATIPGPE
ncbi:MAG: hypothetical protein ACLQOO_07245 [Terriglobia bacterium]